MRFIYKNLYLLYFCCSYYLLPINIYIYIYVNITNILSQPIFNGNSRRNTTFYNFLMPFCPFYFVIKLMQSGNYISW